MPEAPSPCTCVLMTADTVGGVWDYALELAHGLGRAGLTIHLATMGAPVSDTQRAMAEAVPRLTLHESHYRLEWMNDPDADLERAAGWLLALASAIRPDVVHLNGYAHAVLPWHRPVLVVGHSCVLSWWRAVHGEPAPDVWTRYARRVADGLRAADLVAAPTRAMLDALCQLYGRPKHACVIANGRDPALYRPQPKENIVLSAGRLWDPAKNVAALDTIAPALPWPVMVAGSRHHPDGTGPAPEHAVPGNIQYLGLVPASEMAGWYGRAAIFALPARYEPFGLAALEAAMSGCALVLGDIPSLRELWQDTALFVPPDDHEGLRRALCGLIETPERRRNLGEAASRRAAELTAARMIRNYLDIYASLPAMNRQVTADMPTPPMA